MSRMYAVSRHPWKGAPKVGEIWTVLDCEDPVLILTEFSTNDVCAVLYKGEERQCFRGHFRVKVKEE